MTKKKQNKKRSNFDPEARAKALARLGEGESVAKVAADFGVSVQTLYAWKSKAKLGGKKNRRKATNGHSKPSNGYSRPSVVLPMTDDQELAWLRLENQHLREQQQFLSRILGRGNA